MSNKPKKKMGRPKIEFDWSKLDAILRYSASLIDCAEIMECSEDTIQNKIKEKHGVTFSVYRNKKMAKTRLKVLQKLLVLIDNGNVTATIFALKNLCGWSDSPMLHTEEEEYLEEPIALE